MPPLEHAEVLRGGGAAGRRTVRNDLPVYDLSYRDEFWPSRPYEDRCDRIALRALLPPRGDRLIDLGAGYGRLSDEYDGYGAVAMVDRSAELLAAAAEELGRDPRFEFNRSDVEVLPFEAGSVDAVVAVRLLHHLPDLRPTFLEVERVLRPGGVFVLEFANRRHVLSVLRFLARQQRWSPTGSHPHEYFPGHFAHNPERVRHELRASGFTVERVRAASIFRAGPLTRHVPAAILAAVETPLQATLGPLAPAPSVYIRAVKPV